MNTIDVTGHKAVGASEVLTVLPSFFFRLLELKWTV